MKALRWSLIILGATAALLVLAAVLATQLINPNAYRGELERLVSRETGRPFRILGPLRLGWYPWLAIDIGAAHLGNPPGTHGPDLLAWRSARIPVRLLPLLMHRRIELGTVRVRGADIHLWRTAAGVGNWQPLLARSSSSTPAAAPPSLGGLILRNATLEYVAAAGTIRLSRWQLILSAWRAGQPFSVRTRFLLQAPKVPPAGVPVHFSVRRLSIQTAPLRVSAPRWTLKVASAAAAGALQLADSGVHARAAGNLTLTVPSVRGLIRQWGLKIRLPKDPAALGALSVAGRWQLRRATERLSPLTVHLDQTTLTGWAMHSGGTQSRWRFALHANQINVSQYLPPSRKHPKPLKLPLALLRALHARGTLTVRHATIRGTALSDVRLRVQ
jgi:hypothetical protein